MNYLALRPAMRITLRRMLLTDPTHRQALHWVMRSANAYDQLNAHMADQLELAGRLDLLSQLRTTEVDTGVITTTPTTPTTPTAPPPIGGGALLQWLWNNRQEILAFVLQLFSLFSGGGTVPPVVASPMTMHGMSYEEEQQNQGHTAVAEAQQGRGQTGRQGPYREAIRAAGCDDGGGAAKRVAEVRVSVYTFD